jgi:hypothetical protein
MIAMNTPENVSSTNPSTASRIGWRSGLATLIVGAIVTVTVDPVTDTPERLTKFGQEYGADPAVWRFARADYPKMERLVTGAAAIDARPATP